MSNTSTPPSCRTTPHHHRVEHLHSTILSNTSTPPPCRTPPQHHRVDHLHTNIISNTSTPQSCPTPPHYHRAEHLHTTFPPPCASASAQRTTHRVRQRSVNSVRTASDTNSTIVLPSLPCHFGVKLKKFVTAKTDEIISLRMP